MQLNMLEAMNIYVNVDIRPGYCYFISNSVLKIG